MKLIHAFSTAALLSVAACSQPGLVTPSGSATGSTGTMSGTGAAMPTIADQAFITQAAYGGLSEVALGQLAQARSSDPNVQQLAAMLISEHGAANQELVALARSRGVTPPTAPDPGRQAVASALGGLQGTSFDAQYLPQQLAEHQVTIALFDAEARGGADPELRSFAARWLPSIQAHTQHIQRLSVRTAAMAR